MRDLNDRPNDKATQKEQRLNQTKLAQLRHNDVIVSECED